MSNLYNLEPQPTAKCILHTTAGSISLELFAKQTPLASRNFLQHCLDGYYNDTTFHRLVSGFIIQGGDPTGTGTGGVSAINDRRGFADEFHSRLKFNRRGLLGMANDGAAEGEVDAEGGRNGSQFFLTLAATPELQGKNTLFGRVEGDTIYNLMKMAEAELVDEEGSERPLYPTKITGAEVLVNPFDDMVVRPREAPRGREGEVKGKEAKKRKKLAGKNVLSFAGDEGEMEVDMPVLKKARANPRLVAVVEEDEPPAISNSEPLKEKKKVKKQPTPPTPKADEAPKSNPPIPSRPKEEDNSDSDSDSSPERQQTTLQKTNAEIAALKASLKRSNNIPVAAPKEKPRNALEAMIPATSTRGRKRGKAGTDERGAFDRFLDFKARLDLLPAENVSDSPAVDEDVGGKINGDVTPDAAADKAANEEDEEAELCDLHFIANCQSCRSWDSANQADGGAGLEDGGDDDGGETWMAHRLTFAKDTLGKDLEWKRRMEEIDVIDPREKAREIKEERKKGKEKDKEKGRVKR